LVVLGFQHRQCGEEVGAYLSWQGQRLPVALEAQLREAIAALPVELRPKVVVRGARVIPRTHTGKIQRRRLQPLFDAYSDVRGPIRIVEE
jgi:acyl-coenzyme A synthetase/AMP-(fatty) acid ligase